MYKKNLKFYFILIQMFVLSLTTFRFASFADETDYTAVDGNQISSERLLDMVIEYDELGSLIHTNNITIQNAISSTEKLRADYTEIRDYLKTEQSTATMNQKNASLDGDADDAVEHATNAAVYRASIKSYNKMLERLDSYSSTKDEIALERELTNGAQSLMISYQSVALQKDYLTKMEALYENLYTTSQLQKQTGLATDADVLAAYNAWMTAQVSLSSIEDSEHVVYHSLCAVLGVDGNDGMVIAKIPAVDVGKVSEMNLTDDTEKAINNNTTVISKRHTSSGNTASSQNKKQRSMDELEESITVNMKQLYENVLQLQNAYEACKTGYSSGQIAWNNAQSKYSMGMLSQSEWIQAEMNFTQKELSLESAELDLLQALEEYNWAIQGILSVD